MLIANSSNSFLEIPMHKRSKSWISLWSRPMIIVLALIGTVLTSYLTVTHFFGSAPALCTEGSGTGCDVVLNSEYAKIFGVPLTIFGALGYLTLGGLASIPMLVKSEDLKFKENLTKQTAFLLFLVSTATLVFSGYLMYLLAFVIRDVNGQSTFCPYCVSSAVTVTSIWLLNLLGHDWEDRGQLFFTGLIASVIVLTGTVGIYSSQGNLMAQSQTFAGKLAQHLKVSGAKMYGAYWCPHCHDQKDLFGSANKQVPYIECDPRGEKPQTKLCQDKGIKGFPTWEIGGKIYEGQRSLDELANLSGYKGSRN